MVDPLTRDELLGSAYRLNLAGVTVVPYDVQVREVGKVNEEFLHDLLQQFNDVWGGRPFPQTPQPPIASPQREQDEEMESDNDEDEGEEEERRDKYGAWWFE
jgi:ribosomal protein L12E/L44/L45/RPP1/RPP2